MDAEPDVKSRVLQSALDEISTARAGQDTTSDATTPECCVICLDTVRDPSTARPCGHANFDFLCLVSWLQLYPTCPLCKSDVVEVRYGDGGNPGDKIYRVPPRRDERSGVGPGAGGGARDSRSASAQGTFEHYFLGRHRSGGRRFGDSRRSRDRAAPPRPIPTLDEAVRRRRHVYRHQLYSLHVGSNRFSRYRDLTPELFASDPLLVSRARQFIRRELRVFEFLYPSRDPSDTTTSEVSSSTSTPPPDDGLSYYQRQCRDHREAAARRRGRRAAGNNAEFLLEYAVAILKTVDTQGSAGQAEAMLAEFLGLDATRLFLHELRSWLRSPHASLAAWDRAVQYPEPKSESESLPEAALESGSEESRRPRVAGRGGDYWRPAGRRRREASRGGSERVSKRRADPRRRGDAAVGDGWAPD